MKRLISILCWFFICFNCFAQLPSEIKHIEIVSEIQDTMALLNKLDLDKINTAFCHLDALDSLNTLNEKLIANLNSQNNKLESIIYEQNVILNNKDAQIIYIEKQNKEVISNLEKQINRTNNKILL